MIPASRCMKERWCVDPAAFIEEVLFDPETNRPYILTDAQRRFLAHAFELTPDGRLRFPELLFSAPKKSGKTGFGRLLQVVRQAIGFTEAPTQYERDVEGHHRWSLGPRSPKKIVAG
jgi:hypothetical protein